MSSSISTSTTTTIAAATVSKGRRQRPQIDLNAFLEDEDSTTRLVSPPDVENTWWKDLFSHKPAAGHLGVHHHHHSRSSESPDDHDSPCPRSSQNQNQNQKRNSDDDENDDDDDDTGSKPLHSTNTSPLSLFTKMSHSSSRAASITPPPPRFQPFFSSPKIAMSRLISGGESNHSNLTNPLTTSGFRQCLSSSNNNNVGESLQSQISIIRKKAKTLTARKIVVTLVNDDDDDDDDRRRRRRYNDTIEGEQRTDSSNTYSFPSA